MHPPTMMIVHMLTVTVMHPPAIIMPVHRLAVTVKKVEARCK